MAQHCQSKRLFWLSTRPDMVGEVSQAGAFVRHQGLGRWWAATPTEEWPEDESFLQAIKPYWNENYGDRRQEIVFIGLKSEMNETEIRNRLESCLVKDYLTHPKSDQDVIDPFPNWSE